VGEVDGVVGGGDLGAVGLGGEDAWGGGDVGWGMSKAFLRSGGQQGPLHGEWKLPIHHPPRALPWTEDIKLVSMPLTPLDASRPPSWAAATEEVADAAPLAVVWPPAPYRIWAVEVGMRVYSREPLDRGMGGLEPTGNCGRGWAMVLPMAMPCRA
jgi:hypothetical protein